MEGMEKALVAWRQGRYEVYIYSWKLTQQVWMHSNDSELLIQLIRQLGIKAEVSEESWGDGAYAVVDAINKENDQ